MKQQVLQYFNNCWDEMLLFVYNKNDVIDIPIESNVTLIIILLNELLKKIIKFIVYIIWKVEGKNCK